MSGAGQGRAGERGLSRFSYQRKWELTPFPRSHKWDCPPWPEQGREAADFVTLEIEANGFLYNMVRTIVGTLVEVGRGARPELWPGEVLAAADRRRAGRTAPPQGLFLVCVQYPAG